MAGSKTSTKDTRLQLVIGIGVIFVLLLSVVVGYLVVWNFSPEARQERQIQKYLSNENISIAPVTPKQRDAHTVAPNLPRFLSIPAIGVNQARVMPLGVKSPNKKGEQQLDVPKNINDVGWYNCQINPVPDRRCTTPTAPGDGNTTTAVLMAGHTCFSRSMTCVFDKISKLKSGDLIIIERGDGKKINYAVRKVDILKLADVDMAKAMRPIESGLEGLTLITCAGTYRGTVDANGVPTADKRVFVYAVRN